MGSDRPNWGIVRNQPNGIFSNSLSESSAEVRQNRTIDQSLLKWYVHIYYTFFTQYYALGYFDWY